MVGGDSQKSLQQFVAYGYCVFEDDVCVYPSGVPYGRSNYANIAFPELFVRAMHRSAGGHERGA